MISSAHLAPLTLCTTAVSLPSPSFVSSSAYCLSPFAFSSSPPSSSPQLESSPAPCSVSSSVPDQSSSGLFSSSTSSARFLSQTSSSLSSILILLFVSSLSLPLRSLVSSPGRGSGSSKLKSPSSSGSPLGALSISLLLLFVVNMTGGAALPLQQTAPSNLGNKYTMPDQVTSRSQLAENEDTLAENCTYPDFVGSQDLVPPEDGYMADQPPRTVAKNPQFSNEWEKTQARNFYLIASNNQFVQVLGNSVMGTNHQKPVLGLMQSYSHNGFYLIKNLVSERYICMNSQYQLYLGTSPDESDCQMRLKSLGEAVGLHKYVYTFPSHRRYLGIDCDPVSWVDNPEMKKSPVRFYEYYVTSQQASQQEAKFRKDGKPQKDIGKKCVSSAEKERQERIKILKENREKRKSLVKKMRQKWCWTFPKLLRGPENAMKECLQRCNTPEKSRGKKSPAATLASVTLVGGAQVSSGRPPARECVCDILKKMLAKPKRAKRKCLRDKVELWIRNRTPPHNTPNKPVVIGVAKLLVPSFNAIAKRTRYTRCRKRAGSDAAKANNCRKIKGVKINPVLEQFEKELIQTGNTDPLLPSDGFTRALKKLARAARSGSRRRRKHKQRPHRKRRNRRYKKRSSKTATRGREEGGGGGGPERPVVSASG